MNMNLQSVTEYAKQEGISRQSALARIKTGRTKAQKVGNVYIIFKDEPTTDKRANSEAK